ncbi:anoctamin-1 isoform x2 [Limosa lapponica baueri]|uniref:Anoctamin n=1 Tax=Limosa lapponica baueri TaxID=1758121 RepID=A0A2I0TEJ5_LIMLA|nr:anoctamin-1 isoform x2 [Limosa lapponica baueri]
MTNELLKYSIILQIAFSGFDALSEWDTWGDYEGENVEPNDRKLLCEEWASYGVFYKYQPIDLVSMEMCDQRNNITMCPLCDRTCSYWKMSSACATARASHLFDNPATVFFSVFMALWEVPKTDKNFEERLIFKAFLLKFVNAYTPIFYVAFFKGRFVGRPGDYVYIFHSFRMEECAPGGCLMELCIQLSIIMLGKQLIQNNLFEIGIPLMAGYYYAELVSLTGRYL